MTTVHFSDQSLSASEAAEAAEAEVVAPVHDPASPVFIAHEGGKLEVRATQALRDRADLALLYSPGVAEVSRAIHLDPSLAGRYTTRRNTVAVISDGSAVLGLGNIGPLASLPVMEGKAVLFKHFADVDAVPVCMESGSVDELVDAIVRIAPTYGGINLEDISAPRCFEIERQLLERLDIPVFHDDQHGTAVVTLAGLVNAAAVVDKPVTGLRVVISGAGAAGVATADLLVLAGVRDVIVCDSRGIVSDDRADLNEHKKRLARETNPRQVRGILDDAMLGADVFIGLSGARVGEESVMLMGDDPIIFALANPDPEVDPAVAMRHARVVATGRSDLPNQINNVLAFPGIFRGALDSGATRITNDMKLAAAYAIAAHVEEPTADCVIPSVFLEGVMESVAQAVKQLVI